MNNLWSHKWRKMLMVESRWSVKSFSLAVCVKRFITSVREGGVEGKHPVCWTGLSGTEGHSPEWVPCSCPQGKGISWTPGQPLGAVITAKVDVTPCTPFLTQALGSQSREGELRAVAELVGGADPCSLSEGSPWLVTGWLRQLLLTLKLSI